MWFPIVASLLGGGFLFGKRQGRRFDNGVRTIGSFMLTLGIITIVFATIATHMLLLNRSERGINTCFAWADQDVASLPDSCFVKE